MIKNKTGYYSTFAIGRISCFADTLVQNGSSVLHMEFNAKTPCLDKAANR